MSNLKTTGKLSDDDEGVARQSGSTGNSGRGGSGFGFGFGFNFDFEDLFRTWDFEARSQRNQNSNYRRGFYRDSSRSSSGFNRDSSRSNSGFNRDSNRPNFEDSNRPNPDEAKRWMRQADVDLEAARNER